MTQKEHIGTCEHCGQKYIAECYDHANWCCCPACEDERALAYERQLVADVDRAIRPLVDSEDADAQLGLTTRSVPDYEVERELPNGTVYDGASTSQPWFTRSGDNPVIHCQAHQADLARSAGGLSDYGDKPEYLGLDTRIWDNKWTPERQKQQHRNYMVVVLHIMAVKENQAKIQAAWNRFWFRWYQEGTEWISPMQKNCIANTLKRFGAKPKQHA